MAANLAYGIYENIANELPNSAYTINWLNS